ncbi:MAG: hypothetical protein AABX75_01110, partial [Nanoarchaeota archaeon]
AYCAGSAFSVISRLAVTYASKSGCSSGRTSTVMPIDIIAPSLPLFSILAAVFLAEKWRSEASLT